MVSGGGFVLWNSIGPCRLECVSSAWLGDCFHRWYGGRRRLLSSDGRGWEEKRRKAVWSLYSPFLEVGEWRFELLD